MLGRNMFGNVVDVDGPTGFSDEFTKVLAEDGLLFASEAFKL